MLFWMPTKIGLFIPSVSLSGTWGSLWLNIEKNSPSIQSNYLNSTLPRLIKNLLTGWQFVKAEHMKHSEICETIKQRIELTIQWTNVHGNNILLQVLLVFAYSSCQGETRSRLRFVINWLIGLYPIQFKCIDSKSSHRHMTTGNTISLPLLSALWMELNPQRLFFYHCYYYSVWNYITIFPCLNGRDGWC